MECVYRLCAPRLLSSFSISCHKKCVLACKCLASSILMVNRRVNFCTWLVLMLEIRLCHVSVSQCLSRRDGATVIDSESHAAVSLLQLHGTLPLAASASRTHTHGWSSLPVSQLPQALCAEDPPGDPPAAAHGRAATTPPLRNLHRHSRWRGDTCRLVFSSLAELWVLPARWPSASSGWACCVNEWDYVTPVKLLSQSRHAAAVFTFLWN